MAEQNGTPPPRLRTNGTIENAPRDTGAFNNSQEGSVERGGNQVPAQFINTQTAGLFTRDNGSADAVLGVGVNDRAVLFSVAAFLPEETLAVTEKRLEDTSVETTDPDLDFFTDIKLVGTSQYQGATDINIALDGIDRVDENRLDIGKKYARQDINASAVEQNNVNLPVAPILPRFLQEKSFLLFFDSNGVKIVMPFFQNPVISEKRLANYSTFSTVQQDPQLFFLNTNLAEIKVDFKLDFRHIAYILEQEKVDVNNLNFISKTSSQSRLNDVNRFFIQNAEISNGSLDPLRSYRTILTNEWRKHYSDIRSASFFEELTTSVFLDINSFEQNSNLLKAQSLCLLWLWTIKTWLKSSTAAGVEGILKVAGEIDSDLKSLGYGDSKKYVIIKHGPAFYYIPALLLNYDLKETPNTTYDVPTAMAHSFDVSLTLLAKPEDYANTFVTGTLKDKTIRNDFSELVPNNQSFNLNPATLFT